MSRGSYIVSQTSSTYVRPLSGPNDWDLEELVTARIREALVLNLRGMASSAIDQDIPIRRTSWNILAQPIRDGR